MARTAENQTMATGNQRSFHAQRMSGAHAQACGTCACAATSSIFTQTGAVASVSLFVLLIILGNLLLVGLLGVLSTLALSGLTGLAVAGSVGLSKELTLRTQTGV